MTTPPHVDEYIFETMKRGTSSFSGVFTPVHDENFDKLIDYIQRQQQTPRKMRIVFDGWQLFWRWPVWSRAVEFEGRPHWRSQGDGDYVAVEGEVEVTGPATFIDAPWWMRVLTNFRFRTEGWRFLNVVCLVAASACMAAEWWGPAVVPLSVGSVAMAIVLFRKV